jgi:receptor expression-enhancing protein 5/6
MSSILSQLEIVREEIHKSPLKKYADIFENTTKIRVEYALSALLLIPVLMLFYGYYSETISKLFAFIYPVYGTLIALDTSNSHMKTVWLTYWVIYALFDIIEEFFDFLLYWVPFYHPLKVCFFLWLHLPQFDGGKILYDVAVLPYFKHLERHVDDIFGYTAKAD